MAVKHASGSSVLGKLKWDYWIISKTDFSQQECPARNSTQSSILQLKTPFFLLVYNLRLHYFNWQHYYALIIF